MRDFAVQALGCGHALLLPCSLLWVTGMALNLAPLIPITAKSLPLLQSRWHDLLGILGCSMLAHVSITAASFRANSMKDSAFEKSRFMCCSG